MKHLALLLTLSSIAGSTSALEGHANEGGAKEHSKQPNIVELASGAGTFNTLLAAAKAAGLAETLATGGPFTVFAPTDDAFAELPSEAVEALLRPENKKKLAEILSFHVVAGAVDAKGAIQAGSAKSLTGDPLGFAIEDGRLRVNGANVVANDLVASNGVVHVVDRVLTPPSGLSPRPAGRLMIGVYTSRPSEALCSQLGIDRHGSIVITSTSKGSAARAAGLQKHDVIVSIAGEPASDSELRKAKERAGYGNSIELVLYRHGEKLTTHVEVGVETH